MSPLVTLYLKFTKKGKTQVPNDVKSMLNFAFTVHLPS